MNAEESNFRNKMLQENNCDKIIESCRRLLHKRVDDMEANDEDVRRTVHNLVDNIDFNFDIQSGSEEKKTMMTDLSTIIFGCLGTLGLIAVVSKSSSPFLSILGGCALFISGNKLSGKLTKRGSNQKNNREKDKIINSLYRKIDEVATVFQILLNMNQLEGKYKGVLQWLQRTYSYCDNEELRTSISDLLAFYGYEMVEFSDKSADSFIPNKANVPSVQTTLFAVVNKKNNKTIEKGYVVFPN